MPRIVECVPNFSVGRNKETFLWVSHLKGLPKGVLWPAKLVESKSKNESIRVYIKCDNAEMETYLRRNKEMDDVEQSLLGELTTTEKYLIKTQELMWIRGKRGKRVPVLIPPDAATALEYIVDPEVRRHAGLKPTNKYMFATKGDGVISASECINELGSEHAGDLIHPNRLTSTGYRAYMATMAQVIEAIANAIAASEGCNLLDVDPGVSTNRTVYTFVGTPDAVIEGALNAARVAYQTIDMRLHQGEHPRMGALDVCPFIPVQNVTMEDCIECAKEFADKLSTELGVPVYLYGEASTVEHRKTLPQIRAGEFEGLPEKIIKDEWKPDYGPAEFIPSWGATAVGARKFLIAYNINLLGTKEQAHRIALNIREQGRGKGDPGRLKSVQAIGWYLEEANMAQVSVNITDYEETSIHSVYQAVCQDAEELNLAVVGSQIVGVVPLEAIMDTADYLIKKHKLFILEEDQKLRLVINKLGLNSLGAFSPKERIIEYMIQDEREGPLCSMDLKDFILTVGSRSPTPGGGSVSAVAASLGAALGAMVGFLTYGNKKFHELDGQIRELIPPFYNAMKNLTQFIDADAAAFSEYMLALKLPAESEDEIGIREAAMQDGLCTAIQVPLTVGRISNSLWEPLKKLAEIGNINCKSDLQVGVRMLETSVWGSYYNVKINLDDVKDEEFKKKVLEEVNESVKLAKDSCEAVLKILEDRKK